MLHFLPPDFPPEFDQNTAFVFSLPPYFECGIYREQRKRSIKREKNKLDKLRSRMRKFYDQWLSPLLILLLEPPNAFLSLHYTSQETLVSSLEWLHQFFNTPLYPLASCSHSFPTHLSPIKPLPSYPTPPLIPPICWHWLHHWLLATHLYGATQTVDPGYPIPPHWSHCLTWPAGAGGGVGVGFGFGVGALPKHTY